MTTTTPRLAKMKPPTESISTRINKDEMPAAPPMIKWWAASKLRTDREIGCLSPTTKK
jgi:hypothetical protein